MESWWQHDSPGYISIDAQQLLLGFQQPVRLFQKGHASLWQFTRISGTLRTNQPEIKLAD